MTEAGSRKLEAEIKRPSSRQLHPHEKLDAWQKSIALVKQIYLTTAGFPKDQQFGLTSQLQRAAVSVPANISEGSGRGTAGEMTRFYQIARGSLSELDTLLIVALELGFLSEENEVLLRSRITKLNMLLNGMIRHQRSRSAESRRS